jgi:monoamine oxidase
MGGEEPSKYDVLIIGAGLSGIYSLYRMREIGLKSRVLEAGAGEGGTVRKSSNIKWVSELTSCSSGGGIDIQDVSTLLRKMLVNCY